MDLRTDPLIEMRGRIDLKKIKIRISRKTFEVQIVKKIRTLGLGEKKVFL